jgi:pimeloyl-ACP methyl ester carboxylesterase
MEYASMRMAQPVAPSGDGHPVVVFPGLASDQRAIEPLTSFCRGLGYPTHDWGRGFNAGPQGDVQRWLDSLADDIHQISQAHAKRLSLIGWSLGGIYAREVAKRISGDVRQVITIGTPFAGSPEHSNVGWLYRMLSGQPAALEPQLEAELSVAPNLPTTSIYSRSDGIVAWQSCIQAGHRCDVENIEVDGSHCGLGWNTKVLSVLADRLSQPESTWKAYVQ